MRITKRQLKRIIREEYTQLKIRGLLREALLTEGDSLLSTIDGKVHIKMTMSPKDVKAQADGKIQIGDKVYPISVSQRGRAGQGGRLRYGIENSVKKNFMEKLSKSSDHGGLKKSDLKQLINDIDKFGLTGIKWTQESIWSPRG